MKLTKFAEIKKTLYQNAKEVLLYLIGYSLLLGICYIIFYFVYLKFGNVFYSTLALTDYRFWLFNWIICCIFALFGRKGMIRWTVIGYIYCLYLVHRYLDFLLCVNQF